MKFIGYTHRYGDNINTDDIIAARYCNTNDPAILGSRCLADLDSAFVARVQPGDFLVAGENFGCGSSRETAPVALKAAGIGCVIAKSFARIFFRNAINIGLLAIIQPELVDNTCGGAQLVFDFQNRTICNRTTERTFYFAAYEPFIQQIITDGGLVETAKKRINSADFHRRSGALLCNK